jgi:flagellar assembly protein FliH
MTTPALSPSDISTLIDYLLKSRDPATVGLRRILKRKKDEKEDFSLRTAMFEEFAVEGKSQAFSTEERLIIGLEKKTNDLQIALDGEKNALPVKLRDARQQGYNEGYSAGEAAAQEKARKEYNVKLDEVQKKVVQYFAALEESKKSIFANADKLALAFCCEFAKKVLYTEVSLNPEIILSVLQKALSYVADREKLVIRVAKDDLETVTGRKDIWMPVGEKLESIVIEGDERIEKGGCVVESNSGIADARLGVRFDELKEVVFKAWEALDQRAGATQPASDDAP